MGHFMQDKPQKKSKFWQTALIVGLVVISLSCQFLTMVMVFATAETGGADNTGIILLLILFSMAILTIGTLTYLNLKKKREYEEIKNRFQGIADIEEEQKRAQLKFEKEIASYENKKKKWKLEEHNLREQYKAKKQVYTKLLDEIEIYEDELEIIS